MSKKDKNDVLYDAFTIDTVFDKVKKRKKEKERKKEKHDIKTSIM